MQKLRKVVATMGVVAILLTLVISTTASAATYSDVSPGDWYYPYVEDLAAFGVFDASKDDFFPDSNMDRASFAKTVVEAAGLEGTTDIAFPDVNEGDWFYAHVATAVANGVVSGYQDRSFGPGDPVTREQAAKMIVEAFDLPEVTPSIASFPDVPTSDWSFTYVETLASLGIVNGYNDGTFGPDDTVLREQVAKMVSLGLSPEPVGDDVADDTGDDTSDDIAVADDTGDDVAVDTGVFLFEIPKDNFEALTVEDFPSMKAYYNTPDAFVWNNGIFFLSYPHVVEYDWNGNIVSYTDPDLVECTTDMELIGDSLFIACMNTGIYEIDLNENEIVNFYDDQDGIENLQNLRVAVDGDDLWFSTFDGVGKLDTTSGVVQFYNDELGVSGHYNANVYSRDGEVWVRIHASAYSEGYALRYYAESDSFEAYGPEDFKTVDTSRVDFGKFIVSDEGVFVAFQDGGPEKVVLSKFNPEQKKWEVVFTDSYVAFTEGFSDYLPALETYTRVLVERNIDGYIDDFDIYHNSEWKDVPISDKSYADLVMSRSGEDVYYLLSNVSIDVFGAEDKFPKSLVSVENVNSFIYTRLFIDINDKYVVFFSASMNEMMGVWAEANVGGYDIENDYFFEDVVSLDSIPIEYTGGDFAIEVQRVFDYTSGVVTLVVENIGTFELDILGESLSFEAL